MWNVVVEEQLRPLIDAANRHKAAYPAAYVQLQRDPCHAFPTRPFAYRLSGPLHDKVCGVHLKNKYRLAFAMRPSDDEHFEGIVDVLYVGLRETRHRKSNDIWEIVHDSFGVENPKGGHLKRPCCEDGLPNIGEDELDDYMNRLRKFLRGRQ